MEKEDRFIKLPYTLMAANGYVNTDTGEYLKLSQGAKFVYLYLKARNQFFVENKGGQHFESQSTIAEAVGMDTRRVQTILLDFIKSGIVCAEKESCSNGRRWHYKKVNNLLLWKGDSKNKLTKESESVKTDDVPEWLWDDELNYGEVK